MTAYYTELRSVVRGGASRMLSTRAPTGFMLLDKLTTRRSITVRDDYRASMADLVNRRLGQTFRLDEPYEPAETKGTIGVILDRIGELWRSVFKLGWKFIFGMVFKLNG